MSVGVVREHSTMVLREPPSRILSGTVTSASHEEPAHDGTSSRSQPVGPPTLMASLALTPRGHLLFTAADGTFQPPEGLSRRLERAFGRGSGHGLLELGAAQVGTVLPADFSYWRDFTARLVTAICTRPDLDAPHAPIAARRRFAKRTSASRISSMFLANRSVSITSPI